MSISNNFSENLVRFRKIKKLSQRELADKVKISHRMVCYYEKNPKTIQIEKLKLLADTLEVNISDFFNENNKISVIDKLNNNFIKKLEAISSLSANEQKEINNFINYILQKSN